MAGRQHRPGGGGRRDWSPALVLALAKLPAAIAAVIVAVALATLIAFDGPFGYRAKGALLVAGGPCLYALVLRSGAEPPSPGRFAEALGTLAIVELAAILTVTLDWSVAASRWVGVSTQAAAGAAGIVACLRYMRWEQLHQGALAARRSGRP